MPNTINIFSKIHKSRVENILKNPARGFLINARFRRFLCVMAVLFSYIYFASLFIPKRECIMFACGGIATNTDSQRLLLLITLATFSVLASLAPIVMIVTFLLLRRSMRRVTSLPDEYLDEREIANRDWAFSTGYLVIRRVGLGLTILFLLLKALGFSVGYGQYATQRDSVLLVNVFNDYLISLTGNPSGQLTYGQTAVGFYLNIIALLTYVAYSFPLILVAWRESKFPEELPKHLKDRVEVNVLDVTAKYFRRIRIILGIFVSYFLLMSISMMFLAIAEFLTFTPALFYFVLGGVGYSFFVYLWASVKSVEILRKARSVKQNPTATLASLIFFAMTQLFGVAILVSLVAVASGIYSVSLLIIFGLGAAMIPTQIISFVFLRKIKLPASLDAEIKQA